MYNVTIYSQDNGTSCTTMPADVPDCSEYNQTSFPNLIGHASKEEAVEAFHSTFHSHDSEWIPGDLLNCHPSCLKTSCYLFFPRCNATSTTGSFIVPCREEWEEMIEACLESLKLSLNTLAVLLSAKTKEILPQYDYEYLPSRHIYKCYYEEINCKSPPNVTGANIVKGLEKNGSYVACSDYVVYSCTDNSKEIVGNSTVICLYNGSWSDPPVCKNKQSRTDLMIILLPTGFLLTWCIIVVVLVIYIHRGRRRIVFRNIIVFRRQRQFDAYLCYAFDHDDDFVMNTILQELEDNQDPPFKLFIHTRDFNPGLRIFDNIQTAINNSNTAIMIISQAFVNSIWCKEEFERCYIENMRDPAFQLFIIMMQPVGTLQNLTENMKNFFAQRTYIQRDDPDLIKKIAYSLAEVKSVMPTTSNENDANNVNVFQYHTPNNVDAI